MHHGGIWSPTAYKMFLNQALYLFEKYRLGFKIGNTCIHVGSETCADDQLVLSSQNTGLLTMLKVQQNTQMKKDTNSASKKKKSKITIFNCRKKSILDSSDILYQINSKDLEITLSYTHIGVERKPEPFPMLPSLQLGKHFTH